MQKTIQTSNYNLTNLTNINIMLGKNGCGKSTILRNISDKIINNTLIKYITPQRGGTLNYSSGIDENISNNLDYINHTRKTNFNPSFKAQSISLYKNLELGVLRKFENDTLQEKSATSFDYYLNAINQLLDEIELKRCNDTILRITKKNSEVAIEPEQISSGESELICLGVELLHFIYQLSDKKGLLLLDEPDVHLHPDLQDRLIKFLLQLL